MPPTSCEDLGVDRTAGDPSTIGGQDGPNNRTVPPIERSFFSNRATIFTMVEGLKGINEPDQMASRFMMLLLRDATLGLDTFWISVNKQSFHFTRKQWRQSSSLHSLG
ncbi:hypothetical protein IAQ61_009343 [Plenodomus lingam]|uniref:uncharacterized protein n=1 Tax=Leptosphaeria maculans TaxID=5022 RepID=UPI0033266B4F|nr:hypothetical protein IAQ61_009343 [Plenodomus lingam]